MGNTTQKTRELVRADVDRHEPYASVMFSAKVIRGLLNDADRLARLEGGIRALADEMESDADSRTMASGVSVAVSQEKREGAKRLHALLDGE